VSPDDIRIAIPRARRTSVEAVQFGASVSAELRLPTRHVGTVLVLGHPLALSPGAAAALAARLNDQGIATLSLILDDVATPGGGGLAAPARRVADIADWVRGDARLARHPCGCLATGTQAAIAVVAAARRPRCLDALVLLSPRTDLVEPQLALVQAPTLLVEDKSDAAGLLRAQRALSEFPGDADLATVGHLAQIDATGRVGRSVADLAGQWFRLHFAAAIASPRWRIDQELIVGSDL
jgi:putative phosphoribosyl transferase